MAAVLVSAVTDRSQETPVDEVQPPYPILPCATIYSSNERPSTIQTVLLLTKAGVKNEILETARQIYFIDYE